MKIGGAVFCQNFHEEKQDHELYLEDLNLAEQFEPLGFDSIWSVEHHFTPYTMVPDVIQFLTYLCGRTKKIGLGTMVVVLPWHDPVRVAEQLSMLNIMARGRSLTLGFGRGAGRVEFGNHQARAISTAILIRRQIFSDSRDEHPATAARFGFDRSDVRRDRLTRDR